MRYKSLVISSILLMLVQVAHTGRIGPADTMSRMSGPDHKIIVEAFNDPDVTSVTCCMSRAKTDGIKGGLGLAEDISGAAISCQQAGPVELSDRIGNGEAQGEVVSKKCTSLAFRSLQVVRFYDVRHNALAHLVYSDKAVDGPSKNAISVVPVIPWQQ